MSALWSRTKGKNTDQRQTVDSAEILTALKRTASEKKKIFKQGIFVPGRYHVLLSHADFATLESLFLEALKEELEGALRRYVRRKGYQIAGPGISVMFEKGQPVQPGTVIVEGRFEGPDIVDDGSKSLKLCLNISPDTPQEKSFYVTEGMVTLGRGNTADVILPADDLLISKIHCQIHVDKTNVTVEDLDSANGTFLNGQKVFDTARIAPGDRLLLGSTKIEVLY